MDLDQLTELLAEAITAEEEARYADALQAYSAAVAFDDGATPGSDEVAHERRNLFVAWLRFGSLLHQTGEIEAARTGAQRALEYAPLRPRAHALLGLCWMEAGDLARAEVSFRRSLELVPKAFLWVQLYVVLQALPGREDDAVDCLDAALEVDPESADAHFHLGCQRAKRNEYLPAIRHFQRALVSDPEHVGVHAELGWAIYSRERERDPGEPPNREAWRQAEAWLRKAVALDPGYGWARVYLASFLWGTGRVRDANVQFKAAVRVWPEESTAHWCYGDFLATVGFSESTAERYLRQAVQIDPGDPQAQFHLGKHLLLWSRRREARVALERASAAGHAGAEALLVELDRGEAGSESSAG